MSVHDFTALYAQYPAVIGLMPDDFTSHVFILRLARQNQALYIEALHAYSGHPDPFKIVHGILAQHLHAYPTMIGQHGSVASQDIFGQSNGCTYWQKIVP